MILYFSGTGNSRFVARKVAKITEDQILSLNEMLKSKVNVDLTQEERYIFVLPVYAGRIPRIIEEWIRKRDFNQEAEVYFLLTCGQTPFQSALYINRLCKDKHLNLIGFDFFVMPENYALLYDVPSHEEALTMIKNDIPHIEETAKKIAHHLTFMAACSNGHTMSQVVNPIFYKMYVNDHGFKASDACIGCGQCVNVCPLNNVYLKQGKPVWSGTCTQCLACLNICPKEAIDYGKKTKGKPRLYDIARDL